MGLRVHPFSPRSVGHPLVVYRVRPETNPTRRRRQAAGRRCSARRRLSASAHVRGRRRRPRPPFRFDDLPNTIYSTPPPGTQGPRPAG
ncbi:hypothetical protein GUJ93_ZPchr0001g32349 [Zizania palustris]|uniref:Uncharacterized protein n=1 Tax=Zizania palustris TaxID=103762 RepID=A0A8J5RZ51_ZIZPA|nr:hypothetical protein GUJ93_ZPchr0001g32349 [Zizania palustris]